MGCNGKVKLESDNSQLRAPLRIAARIKFVEKFNDMDRGGCEGQRVKKTLFSEIKAPVGCQKTLKQRRQRTGGLSPSSV